MSKPIILAPKAVGGSVERDVRDRFADVINLKDYGATGDGVTDDADAWDAWQDALASGGIGYIPAGSYNVDGVVKKFKHGCIGLPKNMSFDNRFPAIPVGENHLFYSSRDLTINNSSEGLAIAPTIAIDCLVTAAADATINNDNNLLSSCHGIYVQHKQNGGGANNQLSTTGIVVSTENNAAGDNDCSGVAARSRKNDVSGGVGDCAGVGGRVDNYSHQKGGVMGAEFVCNNNVTGVPCPSNFGDVSTSRWSTPLHVTGTALSNSGSTVRSSPMTAAILVQGGGNRPPYWDGIQLSYSMFPSLSGSQLSITKNEIPNVDGTPSASYPGVTQAFESYTYEYDGDEYTKYRLPDTVAINMGSFSEHHGYPDTCIKMGVAKQHIWTPGQYLTVRSRGIKASSAAPITFYADSHQLNNGTFPNTAYAFSHTKTENGETTTTTVASIVQSGSSSSSTININNTAAGSGVVLTAGAFRKAANSNALSLGASGYSWSNVYADTGPWASSDERLKSNIVDVDEALMRAWGRVNFKVFQFKDALAEKGEAARLHVGVIAQQVQVAFEAEGLDVTRYGLFGYDSWDAQPAQYNEWDEEIPAEYEEDGTLLTPARTIHHKDMTAPAVEAGEKYSIRYEEALALECAYQRWRLDKLESKIS